MVSELPGAGPAVELVRRAGVADAAVADRQPDGIAKPAPGLAIPADVAVQNAVTVIVVAGLGDAELSRRRRVGFHRSGRESAGRRSGQRSAGKSGQKDLSDFHLRLQSLSREHSRHHSSLNCVE